MPEQTENGERVEPRQGRAQTGNTISEWLGHRIYPTVRLDVRQFVGKSFGTCPFLTDALREPTSCIKNENSFGVCTVSSASNGPQQDWLACPYRVISSDLVRDACRRIFRASEPVMQPVPAPLLREAKELQAFKGIVKERHVGYVFFQAKLGGEISVISTAKSPEMSFDVTLVEIRREGKGFAVARYGILEIQTMDFHGSYRAAVQNLRDALRLHKTKFADSLKANMHWAGQGVEGPNIANVFKRTFYQVLLKFQLAGQGAAAGTVLAIPQAVWDSWQPFLGAPELELVKDNVYRVKQVDGFTEGPEEKNAHICIFDLDDTALQPISPIRVKQYVKVTADQLSHHAFKVVPTGMLKSLSEADSIMVRIRERLAAVWPELAVG